MFGSSGRVWVRVGVRFDSLICEFFRFDLFRIWVEKIAFKTQNFQADSNRIYKSGQFLSGRITVAKRGKTHSHCTTGHHMQKCAGRQQTMDS